jgi:hypothetical protein
LKTRAYNIHINKQIHYLLTKKISSLHYEFNIWIHYVGNVVLYFVILFDNKAEYRQIKNLHGIHGHMWYLCDYNLTSCNYRHACGAYHNTGHRRLNIPSQQIRVAFSNKFLVCELSASSAELSVSKGQQNYHFCIIKLSNEMDTFWQRTTEFSVSSLKVWVFVVHQRIGSSTTRKSYFLVLDWNSQSQCRLLMINNLGKQVKNLTQ